MDALYQLSYPGERPDTLDVAFFGELWSGDTLDIAYPPRNRGGGTLDVAYRGEFWGKNTLDLACHAKTAYAGGFGMGVVPCYCSFQRLIAAAMRRLASSASANSLTSVEPGFLRSL